jgi:hypothetical protein
VVDLRYHVVSIVAVLLALSIGIVFGTTAINRAILNDLDRNVDRLTAEKRDLDSARRDLAARAEDAEAWGKAVYPKLVTGALSGERVVVVAAPGAPRAVRDDVVKQLSVAGATVTGRIRLSERLVDPARAAELDDLVVRELPQGLTLPGAGSTAAQRAMAELAYVVGTDPGGTTPPPALTRVVAALRERGFLSVDGDTVLPARNVVVLLPGHTASPSPSPSATPEDAVPVAVSLVSSLARLAPRPAVVAVAPHGGSVTGTELEDVRADADLKELVSTVDDVDLVFGQAALVLAIDEARRGGHGHYGDGVGAEAPLPTPTPVA